MLSLLCPNFQRVKERNKSKIFTVWKEMTSKTYDKDQCWEGLHILIMYTNDLVLRTRFVDYIKQGGGGTQHSK